jgi:hypothetical protein
MGPCRYTGRCGAAVRPPRIDDTLIQETCPRAAARLTEAFGDDLAADLVTAGAGVGAADGGGGDGAGPFTQPFRQLATGQTHSTVHVLTGTSFITGYLTSLSEGRTVHRSQHPWQQPSPPQQSCRWQRGVRPGMHLSPQMLRYLYSTTIFVVQHTWQTGTRRLPQYGHTLLQPPFRPPLPQHGWPAWDGSPIVAASASVSVKVAIFNMEISSRKELSHILVSMPHLCAIRWRMR